jgi:hypothetical protein
MSPKAPLDSRESKAPRAGSRRFRFIAVHGPSQFYLETYATYPVGHGYTANKIKGEALRLLGQAPAGSLVTIMVMVPRASHDPEAWRVVSEFRLNP